MSATKRQWEEMAGEDALKKQIDELRAEVANLACEASAFYVLAGIVHKYGLCHPDVQIARLEVTEQKVGEVINGGMRVANKGAMGIATGMLVEAALSGELFKV
jgi:hypothetical protein